MGWVILGVVIAIIIWFFVCVLDGWFSFWELVGLFFSMGALGFFIGLGAYLFLGIIAGCCLPTTYDMETQPIYAMSDNNSVEGQHFLFSGYVKDELVCRYIIETENGKHIEQVDADDTYIIEADVTQPYVEIYRGRFAKEIHYWFAIPVAANTYYKFYIPEGSVTNEYNIDLQ